MVSQILKTTLRTAAVIFHVLALIGLLTALFSNSWEEILVGEKGSEEKHKHGLWQYCIETYGRPDERFIDSKDRTCFTMRYGKPRSSSKDKDTEIHDGQQWRLNALILIAIATVLALASVIGGCCAAFMKCCGIVWCCCSFFMWLLSVAGVLLFTVYAKSEQEKVFYIGPRLTHQYMSWSYIVACVSTLFTTIAMVLSGVTTALQFFGGERSGEYRQGVVRVHTKV